MSSSSLGVAAASASRVEVVKATMLRQHGDDNNPAEISSPHIITLVVPHCIQYAVRWAEKDGMSSSQRKLERRDSSTWVSLERQENLRLEQHYCYSVHSAEAARTSCMQLAMHLLSSSLHLLVFEFDRPDPAKIAGLVPARLIAL